MLNYTSLFADLEDLFRSAGRDTASFQRLAREVRRASSDLHEYYEEVASGYVLRLRQRLRDPQSTLSSEEANLIRGYLGLPPADAEREQQLLDDLTRMEELMTGLLHLKGAPLNLRNLDQLRRSLDQMQSRLGRIVEALAVREQAARFDEALGDGEQTLDRVWLAAELDRALGSESSAEGGSLASDTGEL